MRREREKSDVVDRRGIGNPSRSAIRALLCIAALLAAPLAEARPHGAPPAAPAKAAPQPVVEKLCDALQKWPEERKQACCSTSPTGSLASVCAEGIGRALREGSLSLEPADVERCAAESKHQLEGCDWVTPYLPATPTACLGILHGRLQSGARCRSTLECEDGLACRGGSPTTPGVCVSPGQPGAVCSAAADTLASYARQTDLEARHPQCAGYCVRGRCAAFVAMGGACSAAEQCAPGSHCVSGHCAAGPAPALGEACASTSCAPGLACIGGQCAAPKKAGESCRRSAECAASCVVEPGAESGVCGMKCSAWPPAGYTPPHYDAASSSAKAR
jgi:hypothetical protein